MVMTAISFNPVFCARVRAAREVNRKTQAQMAQLLGVTESAYEKYESRTPLPHHLVVPFAEATGVDLAQLFIPPDWGS
jgi:transcriptional regulator with XRE-family HTH domain